MKDFARLFHRLDQTNKTNEKVAALVGYFSGAPDSDKLWTIAILSHRRPRRTVNTTLLRQWAAEKGQVPLWLFEESYHVVGDLAETIALVLPPPAETSANTLTDWIQYIRQLADCDESSKKQAITRAWNQLDYAERFVFNKLITGGFRVGLSQKLMVRALALYTGQDENLLTHRLMGNWSPDETDFRDLVFSESTFSDDISKPYPFYLAYPLEEVPENLGDPAQWSAEWKWDGIRGQIICRNEQLFVWSRGEELLTDKFPEFHNLPALLPSGTVLDGEILPWRNGQPLPFQDLQTRIGRKTLSRQVLEKAPVAFIAYDLLEFQGADLRSRPFSERRQQLEKLLADPHARGPVLLSPLVPANSWEDLAEARAQARDTLCEGLMLKRRDSSYQSGRKRGDWWKWKVDPLVVDAVMIYAQRGHGRRANLYTDYTFAVWEGDALVPFAKAYSGLTDQEFREITAWVNRNTLERFGPVRSVKPELVFEIAFEGIQASPRHKSGIALRFPRINRWRRDKPAGQADSLENLKRLLANP